ncbi:MAG TPA: nuclear transport factor 2 family protein [Anaerolineales bacterium]|nr:nuclear transport factor 2 family protein [Anaerolineales bacterium]
MTSNANQSDSSEAPSGNADTLRATEVSRLRALVDADMETADKLHAEDFQLITPGGSALSKAEYLSGVASGELDYRLWDVDSPIDVRLFDEVAIIRYRSILHMVYHGNDLGSDKYWHTDSYEWRDGRWQVVWSQATRIN